MRKAARGRRIEPHELYIEAPFLPARSTIETADGADNRSAGEADAISEAELPLVAAGQPPMIVDEAATAPLASQRAIALRGGGENSERLSAQLLFRCP